MTLEKNIDQKIKKQGIVHRFISLPADLPSDIAAHVSFHGIELKQAVPTLIYQTEKGFIAVQRRADTRINTKKLMAALSCNQLRLATEEELRSLGGVPGDVPLTGMEIPYYLDAKVLELDQAYGGGGVKTRALVLAPKDLVSLNQAIVIDVSDPVKQEITGKKRILSGITPSGDGSLHIGNYLGAVRQFIELAKTHECFLMVADLHALTTVQDRKALEHNIQSLVLNELALLGDLTNITFFRQSDIFQHSELTWILNNVTPIGLIKRAHAYKDKLAKQLTEDDVNMGLFCYPVLMAADILLYHADLVPVGKDQKQHVEITRDIAQRFNSIYKKNVLKLPEPYIPEDVAVILGTDGKRKMSKSLGNIISIFEDETTIRKQVMSTYTDPTRVHATDPGHIEGNMIFHYLDFFGDRERVADLKGQYQQGKVADVEVKEYLFESLLKHFAPARERYQELSANKEKVRAILKQGAEKARTVAAATMTAVHAATGLTTAYSAPVASTGVVSPDGTVTIDLFAAMELRVGVVKEAGEVAGSQKLIRLRVDFGDGVRTIFTGVKQWYAPDFFQGKQFIFIVNLAPRRMMNELSEGMILAVDGPDKPIFLSGEGMPIGSRVR